MFWLQSSALGEEKERDGISVYPNPAGSALFYKMNARAFLELSDVNGRVVRSVHDAPPPGSLDLTGIAGGFYKLQVHTTEGIQSKKIVVRD